MNINGDIIIVEDDAEDREFLKEIFDELGYPNKIIFFAESTDVIEYLCMPDVKPFLIISDINMPRMDGYELREQVCNNPLIDYKCIPYIFFTTAQTTSSIIRAYQTSIQGFFMKGTSYSSYKETIRKVMEYWREGITPLPFYNDISY
jgi:CheY-like chemotaxis protein